MMYADWFLVSMSIFYCAAQMGEFRSDISIRFVI